MNQEERQQVDYRRYLDQTLARLARPGLLLAARGPEGRPHNAMTIGWATFGIIWGRPMCVVLVRPSRYTYGLIEACQDFTVNVPANGMEDAVQYLGAASGRDVDKLARVGLTAIPSQAVASPTLAQCPVTYECQVVHFNDVLPPNLASEIDRGSYPRGDYHRIYYGPIVAVTASPAAERL
jgi:flavin reductase (DIM6/NTAB) family NADH-FMN oxidoreductase RutF